MDLHEIGIYDTRNRINTLTGKQWTYSTRSVKTKIYNNYYPDHWLDRLSGILPLELLQELILTFTKPNYTIYDPWATIGSTLLANTSLSDKRIFLYENLIPHYAKYLLEWHEKHFKTVPLKFSSLLPNNLPENNIHIDFVICQIIFPEIDSNFEKQFNTLIDIPLFPFNSSFLEKIYNMLSLGKYAVFSVSNSISSKTNQSDLLYNNRSFFLYKRLVNVNFIPKAELIWQQPTLSSNGTNDTRIWVVRKEVN